MADFKFIYWWEWAHRFLGRFIGVAFAVPLIYFTLTRKIERRLWPKLLALFVLGGAQGALGWYMVASGLVDRIDVSQYRLAAHLTLAALIFAAIIWVAKGVGGDVNTRHLRMIGLPFSSLFSFCLQIAAGGFVAGLDAGQGYATWPKMDGQWIPAGLWIMAPGWKNFFENAMTVQFNHRVLAYVVLLASIIHAWRSFTRPAMVLAYADFCAGLPGNSDVAPARAAGRCPRSSGRSHDCSGRRRLESSRRDWSSDRLIQIGNNIGHVLNAD